MTADAGLRAPPLLEARGLTLRYPHGGWREAAGAPPALNDVSFSLARGERLAVIGESGSGKSTLIRGLLRLLRPVSGQVLIGGEDLAILTPGELRARRRRVQLVFQDPMASLDPAMTVERIVAEPLLWRSELSPAQRLDRVREQLAAVGIDAGFMSRRPSQLSGGQAQRVAIARALIGEPEALLCDEPVSALDMSLRAQVLELLDQQCRRRALALLFVTHDLAAARMLCPRMMVLRQGRVVEAGMTAALFDRPAHAYLGELLAARLSLDGGGRDSDRSS